MALAGNVATGCTVMLNPAAAALLRAAPPPDGALHDWWSLLLALGAGGRVIVDDAPAVLYRQHGNNAVGAASGPARRGLAALRRGPDAFLRIFTLQLDALHAHRALLTPASAAIVDRLRAALPQGPAARLRAMRATRLRRGAWARRLCWRCGWHWAAGPDRPHPVATGRSAAEPLAFPPARRICRPMNIGTRLFTWWHGRLVGSDGAGNCYYEEKRPRPGMRGRRWVDYAGAVEATAIPAEWYGWMHHTVDAPLPENRRLPWQKPHLPNVTGTAASYRPAGHDYSGGRRAAASGDYQAWTPEG